MLGTSHDISVWVHRAERNEQLDSLDRRKVAGKSYQKSTMLFTGPMGVK
jgi:hypothetical protein